MVYVLIEVGCLECGVASNVLGVYSDSVQAQEALDVAAGERGQAVERARRDFPNSRETSKTALLVSTSNEVQLQLHEVEA